LTPARLARQSLLTREPIHLLIVMHVSRPADLAVLRLGYKKARELARRMGLYRGELLLTHPKFPEGSAVACSDDEHPVDISAPDLVYTAEDDKAIDIFNRNAGMSLRYHFSNLQPDGPRT
jgi:hypothetical protein